MTITKIWVFRFRPHGLRTFQVAVCISQNQPNHDGSDTGAYCLALEVGKGNQERALFQSAVTIVGSGWRSVRKLSGELK